MPDTVDDFMQRFGSGGTVDDQQAAQYHDRFVSDDPQNQQFDAQTYHQGAAEYLGQLPDDQFHNVASSAYQQMQPQQRQGLVSSLMGALQNHGADLGSIGSALGLSSTNPQQMNGDDYARLANYARHEQPDAMKQVIQDQPWYLRALGHPVIMGVLGMVASKMLRNRMAAH